MRLCKMRLYPFAEKVRGYKLRITGDIEVPESFLKHKEQLQLLKDWINLASEIGNLSPMLFITIINSETYLEMKGHIKSMDAKTVVGAHGFRHIHYPKHGCVDEIVVCKEFSDWFRFPYLDYDMNLLKMTSQHFNYESSIVSTKMYPFKIGKMIEYPITPPTDTHYRNKAPVNSRIVETYCQKIEGSKNAERSVMFLFHPNNWSLCLMRELAKVT